MQEPLRSLPGFIMQLVQAWVSLKRIANFLTATELQIVREADAQRHPDLCMASCSLCAPGSHAKEAHGAHGGSAVKGRGGRKGGGRSADRDGEAEPEWGAVALESAELCWYDDARWNNGARAERSTACVRPADMRRSQEADHCAGARATSQGRSKQAEVRRVDSALQRAVGADGEEAEEAGESARLKVQGRICVGAGSLNLVIGRVGMGKSSLLAAVAGQVNCYRIGADASGQTRREVARGSGESKDVCREHVASVVGDVALCGQTPWIQVVALLLIGFLPCSRLFLPSSPLRIPLPLSPGSFSAPPSLPSRLLSLAGCDR